MDGIPKLTRLLGIALTPLSLLLAPACDSDSFQGELVQCRCEVETCGDQTCGYELRMDAGCSGQFREAEILIDGHLEADAVAPGTTVVPCTRTDPGLTSEIIVRGGPWIWGPLNERCETPGETRLLLLQCVEAAN